MLELLLFLEATSVDFCVELAAAGLEFITLAASFPHAILRGGGCALFACEAGAAGGPLEPSVLGLVGFTGSLGARGCALASSFFEGCVC